MVKLINYLRVHSSLLKVFLPGLLISVLIFDFFAERRELYFWGDAFYCFWAFFSGFSCLLLVIICRGIHHVWLMRDTHDYDS